MADDAQRSVEAQLEEQQRLNVWLRAELDRQRKMNDELRKAVAEVARTFQSTLVETYRAGEDGDIDRIRQLARANQTHWQGYLQQIIAASERLRPAARDAERKPGHEPGE